MTTWQIEPLGAWTRPLTSPRRSSGTFRASWNDTLRKLLDEIDRLDPVGAVAIRVDAEPTDLRKDGMLRARAQVDFPGVVVSFTSAHLGALSYATDAYEQRYYNDLSGWQANVRAIALSLEALRAVDRYGVTRSGEQYVGWRAIESGPEVAFRTADEALRWLLGKADLGSNTTPRTAYRAVALLVHPDVGGDPAEWARLQAARELLEAAGLW